MKRVLLFLLLAIVVFLGYAATRPPTFHVERSASIAAPPDTVYAHVVSFQGWHAWSPWEKLDPTMKLEAAGEDGSVGSSSSWSGNDKVGAGKMTLTGVEPPSRVSMRLDFLKPFESTSTATFTLAPDASGTHVTWAMDGPMNYMSKVMCIFVNMDKMVGGDFEKGLASLKQVSEAAAAAATAPATPAAP